ncbi:uncharacterized protein LOC134210318 [Armigeres subalbatus]|uniref:uncharacterized protein LOC134210318 n=1 Tax=Armigeres subalbatus TaxID=124917 RepID=UPI002ED3E7B2
MQGGNEQNELLFIQAPQAFNPALYNFPQFKFKHLPSSEVRGVWNGWIRGFERVMKASSITDGSMRKIQMLAMGGLELQSVFDSIPGADNESEQSPDPFASAKAKLDNYFAPKQHESFERYLFWAMSPEPEEPIEKFLERIQQKADKCTFGNSNQENRQIAVVDKIIQHAPGDLREKLLEREHLALDECIKVVNSHQAIKYQAAKMNGKSPVPVSTDVQTMYASASRGNFRQAAPFPKKAPRCTRCGYNQHNAGERCPATNQKCVRCHGIGHFKVVCRSNNCETMNSSPTSGHFKRQYPFNSRNTTVFKKPRSVMHIETPNDTERNNVESDEEDLPVYNVGNMDDELIQCRVGGVNIEMLIDSGSKYNLIDDATWSTMSMCNVEANNLRQQPLLGKITAQQLGVLRIGLGSANVNHVGVAKQRFPCIPDIELTLPIDRSIPPVIQPLRRCPVPLLDKVKAKLDELLTQDIIERVEKPTSWVSPLIPILKDNGDLRMCIDMRRANQAIHRLNHPLPIFEEMLPRIRNARFFSLLDMKESYYHVKLTECCRDVTTFITNWGLYRFKRLFFGVNCAPELFQSLMESLLATRPNLIGFIDDFIVFGETEEAHDNALRAVIQRFNELGVQLNHQKCKFKQPEVVFLGHRLSEKGVLPSDDKVRSVLECRPPKTKEELRSFLGLVTFVSRFLPDLATANHPLRELVKQSTNYVWNHEHQKAFDLIKQRVGSLDYLGYYDPSDRTLVVTDASGVGLGAVLIQFKNNEPRVISYGSKSLSEPEMKCPPIEKEALAITKN